MRLGEYYKRRRIKKSIAIFLCLKLLSYWYTHATWVWDIYFSEKILKKIV